MKSSLFLWVIFWASLGKFGQRYFALLKICLLLHLWVFACRRPTLDKRFVFPKVSKPKRMEHSPGDNKPCHLLLSERILPFFSASVLWFISFKSFICVPVNFCTSNINKLWHIFGSRIFSIYNQIFHFPNLQVPIIVVPNHTPLKPTWTCGCLGMI